MAFLVIAILEQLIWGCDYDVYNSMWSTLSHPLRSLEHFFFINFSHSSLIPPPLLCADSLREWYHQWCGECLRRLLYVSAKHHDQGDGVVSCFGLFNHCVSSPPPSLLSRSSHPSPTFRLFKLIMVILMSVVYFVADAIVQYLSVARAAGCISPPPPISLSLCASHCSLIL